MKDNKYSRTKMRGFIMGLDAAAHMIAAEDDPKTFQDDIHERIKACCEEWNIKLPKKESEE